MLNFNCFFIVKDIILNLKNELILSVKKLKKIYLTIFPTNKKHLFIRYINNFKHKSR